MFSNIKCYHLLVLFVPYQVCASADFRNGSHLVRNTERNLETESIEKSSHVIRKRSITTTCKPGSFYDSTTKACSPCQLGMYQDKAGQTDCHRCPSGRYQPELGQTSCKTCPGTAVHIAGNSKMRYVHLESYVNNYLRRVVYNKDSMLKWTASEAVIKQYMDKITTKGINSCIIKKNNGKHVFVNKNLNAIDSVRVFCYDRKTDIIDMKSALSNQAFPFIRECTKCPKSQVYNTATGSCELCPAGYDYSNLSDECIKCPWGTYSPAPGTDDCLPCPAGSFSRSMMSTTCTKCKVNTYQPEERSSHCNKCPANTFQQKTGQTKCESCEKGGLAVMVKDVPGRVTIWLKSFFVDPLDHASQPYRSKTFTLDMIKVRNDGFNPNDCLLPGNSGWHLKYGNLKQNVKVIKVCCFYGCYETTQESLKNSKFPHLDNCKICDKPDDRYMPELKKCTNCSPGFYLMHKEVNVCVFCGIGRFQDKRGQKGCIDCPKGTYGDSVGRSQCRRCDNVGEFQPKERSTKCLKCEGLEVVTEVVGDTLEVRLPSYYNGAYAAYGEDILNHVKIPRGFGFASKTELFSGTNCIVKDGKQTKFLAPIDTKGITQVNICCFTGCQTFPISHITHQQFPFLCRCSVCSEVSNKLHNITSSPAFDYSVERMAERAHLNSTFWSRKQFDTKKFMNEKNPNYCGSGSHAKSELKFATCTEVKSTTDLSRTTETTRSSELSATKTANKKVYFKCIGYLFILSSSMFLRELIFRSQIQ